MTLNDVLICVLDTGLGVTWLSSNYEVSITVCGNQNRLKERKDEEEITKHPAVSHKTVILMFIVFRGDHPQ